PCGVVHAVAELGDRREHARARLLADVGVVVEDVRDRLHGHASELSDIGHRRHGESFLGGSRFAGRLIWRQSTGGGTLGGGPWTSSRREPCAGRRSRYIVSPR